MKIIGLCASPRANGNTRRLLDYFLGECQRLGAGTEVLSIIEHPVDYCFACEQCMREGKCPVNDDYISLLPKIEEADALVLASPNYAFDISAQLKAVLDRSHAFLYYSQALKRKYGVGICVAGHPAMTSSIARRMGQCVWLCGGYYTGAITGISRHRDKKGFVNEKRTYYLAAKMAGRLVNDIKKSRHYVLQSWVREFMVVSKLKKIFTRRQKDFPYVAKRLGVNSLD